jgi:hypothetical protein
MRTRGSPALQHLRRAKFLFVVVQRHHGKAGLRGLEEGKRPFTFTFCKLIAKVRRMRVPV